ncbi:patatin-like phospholipase family protein [Chitinolyticbacter meiyuanensis]|uniref:patatin-like phospholipase family protein n=1 Tax=Chitinolyticbacter meiyuanensis TaxID=682798 RepID=UPI0011E5F00C|nr:patatin-like phospholipase family protein [Chitinolyticbacter meiyuanensis]
MKQRVILLAGLLACAMAAQAADAPRPRIGLVLGGGGARGLAHVGVLRVLEEAKIPVDCIVGTSMGALVAGSYASGRSAEELAEKVQKANWDDLLSSRLPRQLNTFRQKQVDQLALLPLDIGVSDDGKISFPKSAIATQKVELFLRDMTYGGTVPDFDAMPIPYRAIATDLEAGEMVVMKDGDIVSAMLASMAVPGVFPPVTRDGKLLADGGLSRNLGIDVARELCADVVIAVDVASPPLKRDALGNIFGVADQYTRLMILQNQRPQIGSLTPLDVLITPDLGDLSSSSFDKNQDFIAMGEKAARKTLNQLQRYALPADRYASWREARVEKRLKAKPILDIQVAELKHVNPEVMRGALAVQTGEPLDQEDFNRRLQEVYARGDFTQLDYELRDHGSGQRMTISPVEKDWGPNYLNFGLALGTDFDRSNPYSLTARYRRTWMNSLGGEFDGLISIGDRSVIAAEFYQPLQIDGYAFVAPYASAETGPLKLWNDGHQLAEYKLEKQRLGIDLGSAWARYGEIRIGASINHYRGSLEVGTGVADNEGDSVPLPRGINQWDWGPRFNLYYDQLDNLNFPSSGTMVHLSAYEAVDGRVDGDTFGDEFEPYGRYGADLTHGFKLGSNSGHVTLRGQGSRGGDPPLSDIRWMGGFLNLSSYGYQELQGDRLLYGRVALYRPVPLFSESGKGTYLGAALESGRVFDELLDDGWHYSLVGYLGVETYLGPLYLAAAYGDNDKARYYVTLGNPF